MIDLKDFRKFCNIDRFDNELQISQYETVNGAGRTVYASLPGGIQLSAANDEGRIVVTCYPWDEFVNHWDVFLQSIANPSIPIGHRTLIGEWSMVGCGGRAVYYKPMDHNWNILAVNGERYGILLQTNVLVVN